MIKIKFTITGNQDDPAGNPIPFTRVLASQMRYAAGRYMQWQKYVRKEFLRTAEISVDGNKWLPVSELNQGIISDASLKMFAHVHEHGSTIPLPSDVIAKLRLDPLALAKKPQPIKVGGQPLMELKVFWVDEKHGDADNVFKGIADSLFEQDKEVDGAFNSYHLRDSVDGIGMVDGLITFDPDLHYADR